VTPGPNTKITLAGIGYVVLNEQITNIQAKKAVFTVNMIHIVVTQANLLNLDVGLNIIVSHAKSDLEGPTTAVLDGRAYGTQANIAGSLLKSGPSALVQMPCLGTNGIIRTNSVLTVNLPGILTSGTVKDTAQGTVGDTSAMGETTSTIEGLNLLDGLVKATVIKADAHATSNNGVFSFSDAGSQFLGLSVSGHPEITADVAPNTKIELLGLGTLYLHRVIKTPNNITVRMIELKVTNGSNVFGLPLGSDIQVGVAEASVH
ncbi:MAG: hypothetical protein LC749_16815, partial [Actinobacteria bacterium]|nr:hypothetical protein [Actinomycetota bacterium]